MNRDRIAMITGIVIMGSVVGASLVYFSMQKQPLYIIAAGSLTVPIDNVGSQFEKDTGVRVVVETHGSVEAARQITDVGKPADILAVADYKVLENMILPDYSEWYVVFATNQMVIAYTNISLYANEMNASNWFKILSRPDVKFGHSDPAKDPCGYRTLLVWKLADIYYNETEGPDYFGGAKIYDTLYNHENKTVVPKAYDLVALLESGEIDYIFEYRSVAVQHKLQFIELPSPINLGNPENASFYKKATVTVQVNSTYSFNVTGEPIMYGVTILKNAPHRELAIKFMQLLLGKTGEEIFNSSGQPFISPPKPRNRDAMPSEIANLCSTEEWTPASYLLLATRKR